MPDSSQLPFLLRLFDDQSPTVREAVLQAMGQFGDELDQRLSQLEDPPKVEQRQAIVEEVARYLEAGEPSSERNADTDHASDTQFQPGQLVQHRRYGYRGVVVDCDLTCQADQDWYESNRTQPDRDQPWYHVLVDGSDTITYAAQTSLTEDSSDDEVEHPLVEYFFEDFESGKYVRNDRPWPRA